RAQTRRHRPRAEDAGPARPTQTRTRELGVGAQRRARTGCVTPKVTRGGEGEGGNREVPSLLIVGACGDMRAAEADWNTSEGGGSRAKHGFARGSEPKASDAA